MAVLRLAGKVAAEAVPVAQLARLGVPALIAMSALAVLVLTAVCWVIGSDPRCERVTRLLLAWRGTASSPAPGAAASLVPVSRPRRGRPWRRASMSTGTASHAKRLS